MGIIADLKAKRLLDKYILWFVLVIMVAAPILSPIGLPIPIDPMTQEFYNIIEELPPGSTVWMENAVGSGMMAEMMPAFVACMTHLFLRDIKIILMNIYDATAIPVWEEFMLPELERRGVVGEYGVDWAWLPYVPGLETALAAMAADIRGTVSVDYHGTPLDELPVMEGLNHVEDFDLVIEFGHTSPFFAFMRQVQAPYDVVFICQALTMDVPLTMPYYPLQCNALLKGLSGAAEYEKLIGYGWRGLAAIESTSTSHSWIFIAVIAGNIYFLYEKYVGGKE